MKKILTLSILFFCSLLVSAGDGYYRIVSDGVIIYPDTRLSGGATAVKIELISDGIAHVIASPEKEIKAWHNSLSVIRPAKAFNGDAREKDGKLVVTTSQLVISADLATGAVSFADTKGNMLVKERDVTGRLIRPAVFEGTSLYQTRQIFETTSDDAWYGLGQHQEDAFNYKGQQVLLFQNNTEVAIPYLVSAKNYGILWENYSLTRVGDIRPYQPLSSLRLFDEKGNEGWLTASYANDHRRPDDIYLRKAESVIDYAYLNDSKLHLPADFAVDKGSVTWAGKFSSDLSGDHKLRFTYAGYIKVWIDGKLLFDKWRQAWNPGAGVINVTLQKDQQYDIRIQWIPDGSESYLTANWLPPVAAQDQYSFAFDSEAGRCVDYYFVYGQNMDEVINGYRELTGKAQIVPKWAMGFWQSRERYKTQDELMTAMAGFRKRRIPIDNIVLDWSYWKEKEWGSQDFDEKRFPDPQQMIDDLHKKYKANIMISVWPKFYEGIPAYNYFNEKGWLYKRNIADRQRDWIGQGYTSTFYDAFNKDAREGFWKLIHDKLYTKKIDAWWMDASEPDILSNVSPDRRKQQMSPTAIGTAAEFLNAYPLQNAKGIYEGQRGADSNRRVYLLTRSGYSGSQRYAATIWSGDIASRWEDMKAQISAGLNFSLSGLPYWTMDIGGFSVEKRYENPNAADQEEWRELLTRWHQFGAFVPVFRSHGQFPVREMYNTAPEDHPAYKSMLYYNQLRYRLLPYIYTLAGEAYHRNGTIMRALVFDFGSDSKVKDIGDQYMFGPSLLINPVYQYRAVSRSVYLPAGQGWYDLYTGEFTEGGQTINAIADYERMPVFVKAGAIIPAGPMLQYTSEKPADPITLYVYEGSDGHFSLYEDEGTNYDYEKGQYAQIEMSYDDAAKTLTIEDRKGTFAGMLAQRTFYIRYITRKKPAGIDFAEKTGKKIIYKGKKTIVRLL